MRGLSDTGQVTWEVRRTELTSFESGRVTTRYHDRPPTDLPDSVEGRRRLSDKSYWSHTPPVVCTECGIGVTVPVDH